MLDCSALAVPNNGQFDPKEVEMWPAVAENVDFNPHLHQNAALHEKFLVCD